MYANLIALENISCINLFSYVVQCAIVSVGNDFVAFRLEFLQVVHHQTAKEGCSIFENKQRARLRGGTMRFITPWIEL